MRRYCLVSLFLSLATTAYCNFIPMNVAGSDFLPSTYWQAAVAAGNSQSIHFRIDARGSALALRSLEKGAVDLGVIARPTQQGPLDERWSQTPLAFRVLTVIVHASNPLKQISMHQLAEIYGAIGEHGPGARWGSLGLPPSWDTPAMRVYLPKESSEPLTVDLFQATALPHVKLHGGIHRTNSSDQIIEAVAADPHAIGVINRLCTKPELKTLAISCKNSPSIAFLPTHEAVEDGNYPLCLPFVIVCAKQKAKVLEPAIFALQNKQGQAALVQAGFIAE